MYERLRSEGAALNAIVDIFDPAIDLPSSHSSTPLQLEGVAIAVKDMIAIKGHRRGNGNPEDMASAPIESEDAPVIEAMLEAGARIVATSSLLEYAAGAQHPDIPETRNPLDQRLTAGGSSAGSAALVGAGILSLALGTDTGGSIRIPAAYCGVIGFKPTSGLIPLQGVTPLSPTLDHLGFISTSIDRVESALLASTSTELIGRHSEQTLRLGLPRDLINDPRNDQAIRDRFEEVIKKLGASGVEIVELESGLLEEFRTAFINIVLYEAWEIYGESATKRPEHFGPETLRLFLLGANVTRSEYEEGLRIRTQALARLAEYMSGVDALITPTVPYFAPETTPPIDSELGSYESLYTEIFNVSGQPAITLPTRCSQLPMGIQLIGSLGNDLDLLEIARKVEPVLL
jgi:aspartyl-tRNA(Asn)/glutamyl-tRNA(Gln) amidotransferase subunit A